MRLLMTLVLAASLTSLRADVGARLLVAGVTDDPEPVGVWAAVGPAGSTTLNPTGDARGDGRPHLWRAPTTDDPEPVGLAAVWAWNTGADHDVAFAAWNGAAWDAVEFLSSSTTDDRDPRLFIDASGTAYVVWWVVETETVVLLSRPVDGVWGDPEIVTPDGLRGRRPSVAVTDGLVLVAYEHESRVMVARREASGGFAHTTVATTTRTEPLDAIVQVDGERTWVDWLHDGAAVGCSRLGPQGWSAAVLEPWLDPSWIGVEAGRRATRAAVLSP